MVTEILIVLFVTFWIMICCMNASKRRADQEHEDLPAFREQRRAQSAAGESTTTTTTAAAPPRPSAPPEPIISRAERRAQVKKVLYHRKLEHAESIRTLTSVLAAAEDRYNDDDTKGNVLARTWWSAETSVRQLKNAPPECSICLDNYQPGETACWAKNEGCNHIYHEDCIVQWLEKHDHCPLCRTNLLILKDEERAA